MWEDNSEVYRKLRLVSQAYRNLIHVADGKPAYQPKNYGILQYNT